MNYDLLKPQTSRTTTNKIPHTHTCRGTITTPTRPITHSCTSLPLHSVSVYRNIFTPFFRFTTVYSLLPVFFPFSFLFGSVLGLSVCLSSLPFYGSRASGLGFSTPAFALANNFYFMTLFCPRFMHFLCSTSRFSHFVGQQIHRQLAVQSTPVLGFPIPKHSSVRFSFPSLSPP